MKRALANLGIMGIVTMSFVACSNGPRKPAEQSVLVTAANETAAIARLRAVAAAEAQYQVASGGEYGTLDQLIQKRYVNDPSSGKLTGYKFDVQVRSGRFEATAVPEKFGITGTRSFYVDETNVIHAANKNGSPATASDPEV
ncbi:MAG TPA: hypothetical protein VN743_11030 [Blastocatellia bacterium]|jgi:hypothetical protein|nr:hypothetical protein [Blastocatellia bacterium]